MKSLEKLGQKRHFEGFQRTPLLWSGVLEGLTMFETPENSIKACPHLDSNRHIRLGKLIEHFVLFELDQAESVQILLANIQVFREQVTIGELDCLLQRVDSKIHLEIVYKFYLYDPTISGDLHRWIGPNRRDSLVQKLNKLKDKQLPLLFKPETAKILKELQVKAEDFVQQVYFKAQLFVPYHLLGQTLPLVNPSCILGFYLRLEDLVLFPDHHYHVPAKLDWIVVPHLDVEWLELHNFQVMISEFLTEQKSPLCWMRAPDGNMQQFFVVWWE